MLKTNSGESILLRSSRNEVFHGAGCGTPGLDVDAIVRLRLRERKLRRELNLEAVVATVSLEGAFSTEESSKELCTLPITQIVRSLHVCLLSLIP